MPVIILGYFWYQNQKDIIRGIFARCERSEYFVYPGQSRKEIDGSPKIVTPEVIDTIPQVTVYSGEKVLVKDTPVEISLYGFAPVPGQEGFIGPLYGIKGNDNKVYDIWKRGSVDKCGVIFAIKKL